MPVDPTQAVTSAGESVGRAVRTTVSGATDMAGKAAARTREEAEDIFAEARTVAGKEPGRDAAVYAGIAATTALGVVELPVAAALGAGYAVFRRFR